MKTIPIVPHAQWAQALCARCAVPGRCCQRFILFAGTGDGHLRTEWDDMERADVIQRLRNSGLPFVPLERYDQYTVPEGPDAGRTYSAWWYACPKLVDGRCSDYDNRPQLCRDYEPASSGLCAMYKEREQ